VQSSPPESSPPTEPAPEQHAAPSTQPGCLARVLASLGALFVGLCVLGVLFSPAFRRGIRVARQRLQTMASTAAPMHPSASAPTARVPAPIGPRWAYDTRRDELRATDRRSACLASTGQRGRIARDVVSATGSLCFRQTGAGPVEAWVEVSRGMINCSFQDCAVRVAFDEGDVETLRAARPGDGTHTRLQVLEAARLLERVRASHRIVVEAGRIPSGSQQLVFDEAQGLVWPVTP
jgi:hypothetical protein